jgi:UDP-N-acetylmuramyl pentapeptide phosphotransferase/UDP-N-acetylglucosamine-1-phosphate transferase/glycosyltransferase involved in cell wall biosynthesis
MGTLTYAITAAASTAAALGLTPLSVALARRWGVLDLPGTRKVHGVPTPRLGGVAIAAAAIGVSVVAVLAAGVPAAAADADLGRKLAALLVAGLFVLGVGVVDDLVGVRSTFKLLALAAAALTACAAGVRVDALLLNGREPVALGWAAWPLTVLWIVGVTVSINFIDGLDGLAAGIAAVACAAIAVAAGAYGHAAAALAALALLGSLAGFLVFNSHPARVFMGDGGSMFVGFAVAALAVLQHPSTGTTVGLLLPALALAVPLLDAALTVVRRGVIHRSLFAAERDHIHHRLLALGLGQRHAVLVLYAATLASAGVGLLALTDNGWATAAGLSILVPLLLGLFRTAGSTRLRETIAAVRRNRGIARQTHAYQRAFEALLPRFRETADFAAWWDSVCAAAEALHFVSLSLPVARRDGAATVLRWARDWVDDGGGHAGDDGPETMTVGVPVAQRRHGVPLRVSAEVAVLRSLEVAGQRVALFARLVGEHSVAKLPDATKRVKALGPSVNAAGGRGRAEVPAAGGVAGVADAAATADGTPLSVADLFPPPAESPPAAAPAGRPARKPRRWFGRPRVTPAAPPAAAAAAGPAGLRVAVVHDFLYCYAGAERVLEQILNVYPDAEVFALFDFLPPGQRSFIRDKPVRTSFIQRLPLASRRHRMYLPLMPLAVEQLDVSAFDVVISSSYLAAKGVLTRPDQLHVCYCHTPVRFAWDLQNQYLGHHGLVGGLKSAAARLVLHYIRSWDLRSASGVDVYLTNSDFVGRRIRKVYRRSSTTLYPPVDTERFAPGGPKEDFYLTASRLVPYKRVDLVVEAFNRMPDRRLVVVGDGPEFEKVRAIAGPNVRLVGHQPFEQLRRYMQLARAFVFAAEEDFGIVPVEAQACGTPVIAFGRGGVTESVVEGRTGVFFAEQTPAAIAAAVRRFEANPAWDAAAIRAHAEKFSCGRFRDDLAAVVADEWAAFAGNAAARGPHEVRRPAARLTVAIAGAALARAGSGDDAGGDEESDALAPASA